MLRRNVDFPSGLLIKNFLLVGVMVYFEMNGTNLTMLIVAIVVIGMFGCTCGDNLTVAARP
jgi:hypothetical protein